MGFSSNLVTLIYRNYLYNKKHIHSNSQLLRSIKTVISKIAEIKVTQVKSTELCPFILVEHLAVKKFERIKINNVSWLKVCFPQERPVFTSLEIGKKWIKLNLKKTPFSYFCFFNTILSPLLTLLTCSLL